MAEEKQKRGMSIKRFLRSKLSGKTTAEGYLTAHRAFLDNHSFLSPILEAYDQGELLPSPTLMACKEALLVHLMESDVARARASIERAKKKDTVAGNGMPSGNYIVSLMVKKIDREGNVSIELGTIEKIKVRRTEIDGKEMFEPYKEVSEARWAADNFGASERLADRKLFGREDSVYAEIENTQGKKIITRVERRDAIARILRKKKGAVSRQPARTVKSLKWGVKSRATHSVGPWSLPR